MNNLRNLRYLTLFILFLGITVHMNSLTAIDTLSESNKTNFSIKEEINVPKLYVLKEVEKSTVNVGDKFLVTITIHNYGNSTAYNVSFKDTFNPEWLFQSEGLSDITYPQIKANETREFAYTLTANKVGNYTLNFAEVTYYDSLTSHDIYSAKSNQWQILIITPTEDLSLSNLLFTVTVIIVIIIADLILVYSLFSSKLRTKKEVAS